MQKNVLLPGDTIGIIAPSRPIHNIREEVYKGIATLENMGFKVKLGKNLEKRSFYSAGTLEERVNDLHEMFSDPEVKAIICATGGSSANQLLELIDFELVRNNPKIFMGYSDITVLLLALYKNSNLQTVHGPTAYELSTLTNDAKSCLLDLFKKDITTVKYPPEMKVLQSGEAQGKLIGGNLTLINSIAATQYFPELDDSILFWEEIGDSPAEIDFKFQALKLTGAFEKIKGMVIGHLSDCTDKKYPEDNRNIEDIVLERTAGFTFPIIKVEYFGHDVNRFYPFPMGADATLDTKNNTFSVSF